VSYSGRVLVFLVISLIAMLAYAGFNFFVTSHAEEVISKAPQLPAGMGQDIAQAACERAEQRYDDLINTPPADGNFERRDLDIDFALAEIDRSCG